MLYSELSSRMVDVLGISLIRLLSVYEEKDYDKISKGFSHFATNNSENKFIREAIEQVRKRGEYATIDGRIFETLVSRYRELESREKVFLFRQCPSHRTWLQPEQKPFPHWSCWFWKGCEFKRAAKLRTQIERSIFNIT